MLSFAVFLSLLSTCLAKTINYSWSIDFVNAAPDNYTRQVIGINGAWPCPAIEGRVGDSVVIKVTNNLGTQSTGIHFHGLNQFGTQISDGPSGVTQCPIPPGSTFTYKFNLDSPGTYWYHSHNMGQYPDGLRGPLIIYDPKDPYAGQYDQDLGALSLSDWYHTPVPELIDQMLVTTNTHFLPPFPDALLLNDTITPPQFNFQPGKRYKIRFVSISAFASVLIQFDSHIMKIIEIDGSYVAAHNAYQLRIAPAQRYTVILTAPVATSIKRNFGALFSLDENRDFNDGGNVWPYNITGVIEYNSTFGAPPTYVVNTWTPQEEATLVALSGGALLGGWSAPTVSITLDFDFCFDPNGIPRTCFNNITYVQQKVPTLYTAFSAPDPTNPVIYGDINPYIVNKGDIVQIAVNNLDVAIHPFHLHGHQFQLLERAASGAGTYGGSYSSFPANPSTRDTVQVNGGSYAVIRFQANNPGVWLFHCHIEWHVIMGLIATIIEAPTSLTGGAIPSDHAAACTAQGIPTKGNAAGNTANYTNLTGANTAPPFPDNGATYPKRSIPLPGVKRNVKLGRRAVGSVEDEASFWGR